MSEASWIADNNRYLTASFEWLRLRLQELSGAAPAASPEPPDGPLVVQTVAAPVAAPVSPTAPRSWFGQKPGATAAPAVILLGADKPAPPPSPRAQALAAAAAERASAATSEPAPALVLLARRFGLSDFERDILLLCAAAELEPGVGALYAAAQGVASRSYPTFALARQLLDDPAWDALAPQRPLRYAHLLDVSPSSTSPLTLSPLRADERIVSYIKGLNLLDDRLASLLTPPVAEAPLLSSSQATVADDLLQRLREGSPHASVPAVQLIGTDPASKQAVARTVCAEIGRTLYRAALEALPTPRAEIESLVRLWQRDSALLPVALYIDAEELDNAAPDVVAAFQTFMSRQPGLVFIGLRERVALGAGAGHVVEVGKPLVKEQCAAWQEVLGAPLPVDEAAAGARLLAGQFDLGIADIHRAAAAAIASAANAPLVGKAWDACRGLARPRLDALAQRIEPKATWDDLVLSDESRKQLRLIAAQVRGRYEVYEEWGYARRMTRGFGISALFAGESGTGKTMAAEVVANELGLHLYRIDLSAVVSKYIGETEKNLRRLFDAAEQGGAILFFDEADALFGKRSEVKDSHDRYANIEINYLLQRMESFGGCAILATNAKSALDPAFMRRLRFIINFPFPGVTERLEMWRKVFPAEVRKGELDYERLARFSLSGGNIHSIGLNAAFAAADQEDRLVTQPLLLSAVRAELRKLDKPINEAEFR